MGNYRFRFSDMMPNAWFYKLRDMSKPAKTHHAAAKKKQPPTTAAAVVGTSKTPKPRDQNPSRPRQSYYFTRDLTLVPNGDVFARPAADLPDPPRKSAKQRTRKRSSRPSPKRVVSSSAVSTDCSCRNKSDSPPEYSSSLLDTSPDKISGEDNFVSSWCEVEFVDKSMKTQLDNLQDELDSISDLHNLPPITTKPPKFNDMINQVQKQRISIKEQKPNTPARKKTPNSPGMRLRIHSPKISGRRVQAAGRRSVSSTSSSSSRRSISESCAVVKSSFDPQRDFKESMMEMITENNLRASKDLEDLLACYLSLNSDEYHELIIKVFKQIWFDLCDLKFK